MTAAAPSPYWPAGSVVLWRYRRSRPLPRLSESVLPVRVVRDDADCLAAWLAPATPVLRPVRGDGGDLRGVPVEERFDYPRHGRATRLDTWQGPGALLVSPQDVPWSVWLFWGDAWRFRWWYVNLEDPHARGDGETVTQDHVLDVIVHPDRRIELKDEDELAAAVAAGRFSPDEAAAYRRDAEDVRDVVRRWLPPFCDGWEDWRPDPSWAVPQLPADAVASAMYR
jgi:hypothetical protein